MEEVGEGEGGAEQGLRDLWDHLVVEEERVINVEVDCGQCKNEGKRRSFPPQMSWRGWLREESLIIIKCYLS